MTQAVEDIGGVRVMVLDPNGPAIATERDGLDLIGETYGQEIDWLAVPVARLSPDFLKLSTGLAGAILQKAVQYQVKVAIVGDISDRVAASQPLNGFVGESNRGRHVWFVESLDALRARISRRG